MAKRIAFFNHKGGVSKTTSVYNIGWMLSSQYKVLLVDADSQCNLTSLLLQGDFEKYYLDDATRLQNIKDGVANAFRGKPVPLEAVECFSPSRAPNLYLLAGHANLSEYDAALTFAQTASNAITTLQNLPGAFSELIRITEEKYNIDYTLIDLNPSLSAINQNLILVSDAFVIPTNPDPFSIMALDTLKTILPKWAEWKENSIELFQDSAYPLPEGKPKFLGVLIQRFNIRNGKAAKPYRDNINEIKNKISTDFFHKLSFAKMTFNAEYYPENVVEHKFCLAEVSDFQGLLPKAHQAGVPIFALTDNEIGEAGDVLNQMKVKRDGFKNQFLDIANKIAGILSHE